MTSGSRLDPDPNRSLAKRGGEIYICRSNDVRCGSNPRSDRNRNESERMRVGNGTQKFFVDHPGYMLLDQGLNRVPQWPRRLCHASMSGGQE